MIWKHYTVKSGIGVSEVSTLFQMNRLSLIFTLKVKKKILRGINVFTLLYLQSPMTKTVGIIYAFGKIWKEDLN